MKKNELAKLKSQTPAELLKLASEYREKLVQLKRDIAANKTKNVHAAQALRRDIARVMTFASKKESTTKK